MQRTAPRHTACAAYSARATLTQAASHASHGHGSTAGCLLCSSSRVRSTWKANVKTARRADLASQCYSSLGALAPALSSPSNKLDLFYLAILRSSSAHVDVHVWPACAWSTSGSGLPSFARGHMCISMVPSPYPDPVRVLVLRKPTFTYSQTSELEIVTLRQKFVADGGVAAPPRTTPTRRIRTRGSRRSPHKRHTRNTYVQRCRSVYMTK